MWWKPLLLCSSFCPVHKRKVYPLAEGESNYEMGYETDGEGKTSVPLGAPGLWSLHCIYMRPHADQSKADWESFFATLSFFSEE